MHVLTLTKILWLMGDRLDLEFAWDYIITLSNERKGITNMELWLFLDWTHFCLWISTLVGLLSHTPPQRQRDQQNHYNSK